MPRLPVAIMTAPRRHFWRVTRNAFCTRELSCLSSSWRESYTITKTWRVGGREGGRERERGGEGGRGGGERCYDDIR